MNLDNFEKGQWIYLSCHNYICYNSMVGKGGKAAVGGCMDVVIKRNPTLVLPVLEWGNNEDGCDGDEMMMPCHSGTSCSMMR